MTCRTAGVVWRDEQAFIQYERAFILLEVTPGGSPLSTETLLTRIRLAVIVLYFITVVHHVIEGLGWVFGFRLNSLLTPVTFGIPLVLTLGVLHVYRTTRHAFALAVLTIMTLLFWVIGIGLTDGLYNHTLNVLLFIVQTPASVIDAIYPTYVQSASGSGLSVPCDGVQFSYCAITPASTLYELAGIASFVVACWLGFDLCRLVLEHGRGAHASVGPLPQRVVLGLALALVSAFGLGPTLGLYMASRNPASLLLAVALMTAGLAGLGRALLTTRARHATRGVA
jgi:hypothetical protein